jgi:hypothetical protein
MGSPSIPSTVSNSVSLNVTGGCNPTNTPTITQTPTITPTTCIQSSCIYSGDGNDPGLVVITSLYSGWGNAVGPSAWISTNATGTPPVAGFTDTRTLNIPAGTNLSLSTFTLYVMADDQVAVTINGANAGGCGYLGCYMSPATIVLPSTLFNIGANTIVFTTPNGDGGPGGLDFELCANLDNCNPTATPTPTLTPTPTVSPTPTPSYTPSLTSTITFTPTITMTPTNTPVGLHLWPNPYNPDLPLPYKWLKVYQAPLQSHLFIYTVSGELVIRVDPDNTGLIRWDGHNKFGILVSGGIYYYVLQSGSDNLLSGTLLIVRN